MRVLHLVATSLQDPVMMLMQKETEKFYNSYMDGKEDLIKTVYYACDDTVDKPQFCERDEQLLRLPFDAVKTPANLALEALHCFYDELDNAFDYVLHSTVSTLINIPVLNRLLKTRSSSDDELFLGGPHLVGDIDPFVEETCLVMNSHAAYLVAENQSKILVLENLGRSIEYFLRQYVSENVSTLPATTTPQAVRFGAQYTDFSRAVNLDGILSFRNRSPRNNADLDLIQLTMQVQMLYQRYVWLTRSQPVVKVFYFTQDVTQRIWELCEEAKASGKACQWSTDGSNTSLDALFGNPMPNYEKTLMLCFPDAPAFSQRSNLTFDLSLGKHLLVY